MTYLNSTGWTSNLVASPQLDPSSQKANGTLPMDVEARGYTNAKPVHVLARAVSQLNPQEMAAEIVSDECSSRVNDPLYKFDNGGLQETLEMMFHASNIIATTTSDPVVKIVAIERANEVERLIHQNKENHKKFPLRSKLSNREFFKNETNVNHKAKLSDQLPVTLTNTDLPAQLAPSYYAELPFSSLCKLLGNKVITWLNSQTEEVRKHRKLIVGLVSIIVIAKIFFDYTALNKQESVTTN